MTEQRRPRGLKRSTQNRSENLPESKSFKAEKESKIHLETLPLPEEILDAEAKNDAISLYHAGIVELEKGEIELARKFLEGAVHEFISQLASLDKPSVHLLYHLGMVWTELAVLDEEYVYIETGLEYLKKAQKLKSESSEESADKEGSEIEDMELAMAIFGTTLNKFYMKHADNEACDTVGDNNCNDEDEDDDGESSLIEASEEESKAILHALAENEKFFTPDIVRERKSLKTDGMALNLSEKLLTYSSLVSTNQKVLLELSKSFLHACTIEESKWQVLLSLANVDLELGRSMLREGQYQEGNGFFKQSHDSLNKALAGCKERQSSSREEADIYSTIGEVFVQIGNSYGYLDNDDASIENYKKAYTNMKKAKELCDDLVSDELLQEVEMLYSREEEEPGK